MNKRCIYYNECQQLIYPDDPEAPKFRGIERYLPSLCDTCYGYRIPEEPSHKEEVIIQRYTVNVNEGSLRINKRVGGLEAKVKYLLESKKKPSIKKGRWLGGE